MRIPSAASPAIVTKNHAAGAVADCQRQSGVVTVKSSKMLLCDDRTHRHRNIADIGAAHRENEEGIAAILTGIRVTCETVAVGR